MHRQLTISKTNFNSIARDSRILRKRTHCPLSTFCAVTYWMETGSWRDSDVMDGRLLSKAHSSAADVYIFGRNYTDGSPGIHDVQMNQGSSGSFVNNSRDDHNDHNDIWQDGAVVVDLGQPECAASFRRLRSKLFPPIISGIPCQGATRFKIRMPGFWREINITD